MIRKKIQSEMKAQGINQTKLCEKTGLTNAQLSNFLSGKKNINSDSIEAIFKALNIDLIRIL